MESSWNYQIVNLRVLAVLSVVLGHSCIIYDGYWDTYPAAYESAFFMWLKMVINSYQMELLFVISGFLFFTSSRKHSYLEIIKNKSKRLLIPFFFVGLCWLIPVRLLANYPGYGGSYINGLKAFLHADWGHLWFLPVLFILFVCLYYPLKGESSIKKDIVILLISLTAVGVSSFIPLFPLLKLSLNWAFWFVLGFYFKRYGFTFPNRKTTLSKLILSATVVSIPLVAMAINGILGSAIGFVASLLIVLSSFLFVSERSSKVLSFLGKNSMGIFLFHSPIIYVLFDRFAMSLPPLAMVALCFIVSTTLSICISLALRKARLGVLIGE